MRGDDTDEFDFIMLASFVAIICIGSCLRSCDAEAQSRSRDRHYLHVDPADRLALSKMCVHEGGWLLITEDCDAIYSVLMWRSVRRGVSIAEMAEMYGPMVFDETREDSEAWKVFLTDSDDEPKLWPERLSWGNHIRFWRAMRQRANDLLSRRRIAACAADHWGAHGRNAIRAFQRGLRVTNCGPTRNIFYTLPPRLLRSR